MCKQIQLSKMYMYKYTFKDDEIKSLQKNELKWIKMKMSTKRRTHERIYGVRQQEIGNEPSRTCKVIE